MPITIPNTIRDSDKSSLERLLQKLEVHFLDVNIPADDNMPGYEEITLYVKPKAVRVNQRFKAADGAQQIAELAMGPLRDNLAEETGASDYIPTMLATQHVADVLFQLADSGSYAPTMKRSGPFNYASGYVNLRINGSNFKINYTEDVHDSSERQTLDLGDGTFLVMDP
jgi:hypothetical protein